MIRSECSLFNYVRAVSINFFEWANKWPPTLVWCWSGLSSWLLCDLFSVNCGIFSVKGCSFGEKKRLVYTFCTEQWWEIAKRSIVGTGCFVVYQNIKTADYSSNYTVVSLCEDALFSESVCMHSYSWVVDLLCDFRHLIMLTHHISWVVRTGKALVIATWEHSSRIIPRWSVGTDK